MADAFGDGGGNTNVKRLVTTPAFLILGAVVLGALAFIWFSRKGAGGNAAQGGVVANPLTGPAQGPEVLSTVDTTGLQQQLSNLTQQISTGLAGGGQGNQPHVPGNTKFSPGDWKFVVNSYEYAPGGDASQSFNLGGYTYTFLPNDQAARAAAMAGQTLYWFPGPGQNPIPGAVPGVTGAGYVRSPAQGAIQYQPGGAFPPSGGPPGPAISPWSTPL